MAANREDINRWIQTAKEKGCKYIISVCDTFDWDDYPVYCRDENDLIMLYDNYDGINMQKINELIRIDEDGTVTENLKIHNVLKR